MNEPCALCRAPGVFDMCKTRPCPCPCHGIFVSDVCAKCHKPGRQCTCVANATQVGGSHYLRHGDLQVWDAVWKWGLGFFQGCIVKYVVRYRDKGGVEDLRKARHYIDKLIELEEQREKDLHREQVGQSGAAAEFNRE